MNQIIIYNNQVELIIKFEEWSIILPIKKYITKGHYIKKLSEENHMVISLNTEKTFNRILQPIPHMTLNKTRIVIMKNTVYEKPTSNIILVIEY